MAQIFLVPSLQSIAATGSPHAGAKLYFYQTATTTPITVYQDEAATTPHTNPVIADSAGRFAPIYVTASEYKIVLTDANDVTIQTIDPVNPNDGLTDVQADIIVIQAEIDDLQADVAALESDVDALQSQSSDPPASSRTYINTGGTTMLLSGARFPSNFILVDFNGSVILDVSALTNFEEYEVSIFDYASTRVSLDAGTGNTWVGSAARDGLTESQSILMYGGESMIFRRVAGNRFAIIAGVGNPDIYRSTSGSDIRHFEQPDGRFMVYLRLAATASADTNFDYAITGRTVDFTNAFVVGTPAIIENTNTNRDPVKVRSLGNDGGSPQAGRIVITNPNALNLVVAVTLYDVEIT